MWPQIWNRNHSRGLLCSVTAPKILGIKSMEHTRSKFLHGSALLTETLGKTGIKSSKQVEEQKSAESRRYQLSRREKFGSSSLSPENIKPGRKSCSGTQHPTPTNPCREQQEAPLKLTRHLLAFLEVERVFQYNKQRGHTWVMESFHIQAEQVPLSCFISSIRSSQNPTGLRCPPRGWPSCPTSSWSELTPTPQRRCEGWGHTLQGGKIRELWNYVFMLRQQVGNFGLSFIHKRVGFFFSPEVIPLE